MARSDPKAGLARGRGLFSRALPAVVAGLGAWLAWEAATEGLAQHLQKRRPEAALALASDDPGVLAHAAESRLRAGDVAGAADLSRRALARAPLEVRALRTGGMSLVAAGRSDDGAALLALAGERSWRDAESQGWLMSSALERGDFEQAMQHGDALMRRIPASRKPMFQLMSLAAGEPAASQAIVARLGHAPAWREAFLSAFAAAPDEQAVARVYQAVNAGPAPLNPAERAAYVGRFVSSGRFAEGRAVAQALAGPPAAERLVFDGTFDEASGTPPFAWAPRERKGAEVAVLPAPPGASGPALRVAYDGFSSAELLRQMLVLPPGAYRIQALVHREHGPAERLLWRLDCVEGPKSVGELALPQAPVGSWRRIAAVFTVPDGCEAQWLKLVGDVASRRTDTTVWFDDLAIEPAGAPASPHEPLGM